MFAQCLIESFSCSNFDDDIYDYFPISYLLPGTTKQYGVVYLHGTLGKQGSEKLGQVTDRFK
jgi:hypothetical protein